MPDQENTIGFRNLKVYYFHMMLHIYANDALRQTELKGEGVIIAWILDRQKCLTYLCLVIHQIEMKSWISGKLSIEIGGFTVER